MKLLDKITRELNEAHPAVAGFKQIDPSSLEGHDEVDWDFNDVDIIKSSLGKKKGGGGGGGNCPPKKGNVHDIDPPPEDDEEKKGGGKGNKMKQFDRPDIQIGSIVQDHKSGQKGRVVNIDGDKIEIEPLTPAEMSKLGVSLKRAPSNMLSRAKSDFGRFK